MVASGNDFVVIESGHEPGVMSQKILARNICERKYGVGADGVLVLEKSKVANVRMRIFNADGSEAEMCGNGARCVALYVSTEYPACPAGRRVPSSELKIETKAGVIESEVKSDNIKIKLTDPKNLKLGIPIKIGKKTLRVNFINTGVPHAVIFVEGIDKIDVFNLGRFIRFHKKFQPRGTNVDFVEALSGNSLKIRTYERGVEDETLACGTGSVAAALITSHCSAVTSHQIGVSTKSGERLKVYFDQIKNSFKNVWLEGKARIVYKGVYYV
jgi:diaminopimelate epimerase